MNYTNWSEEDTHDSGDCAVFHKGLHVDWWDDDGRLGSWSAVDCRSYTLSSTNIVCEQGININTTI